jgi:hypothetical protein
MSKRIGSLSAVLPTQAPGRGVVRFKPFSSHCLLQLSIEIVIIRIRLCAIEEFGSAHWWLN